MAKQQSSQKHIFKIHSTRLDKSGWNLKLNLEEAKKNQEIISLAESSALRFIKDILKKKHPDRKQYTEEDIKQVKKSIKEVKKLPSNTENRKKMKQLYKMLDELVFVEDYVNIIIDKNKHYDRANKGFFINNKRFVRLLATNGGVKKSTVVYVSEEVYEELSKRVENGRDATKKFVPAKLEAYKSLVCSASIPVTAPKGVLVVHDCETIFKSKVTLIDDTKSEYPVMENIDDYEIKLSDSDGYGLILPSLAKQWGIDLLECLAVDTYIPSGFCIRNSFTKGMEFTFDFREFAKKVAKTEMVQDAWGEWHNINDIELILTTSMLKLWDSYRNINHYLQCCEENGYGFSVVKVTPHELENERNLNYQFIQSLHLTDEDIKELIQPTINEIHDVLGDDYRKTILFLRGVHLSSKNAFTDEYDFIKAIMIDRRMMEDPFIVQQVHKMIKKRINESKVGVLKARGNFQIISGDPYSLCQSMFGLEVTGLLKAGQIYSKYWNDLNVDKVATFRAPMTCHQNIKLLNIGNTEEMQHWYQYMQTCLVLNSWDTTCHALNGADKDGDTFFTTDNKVIIRGIRELPAIVCIQKTAEKKVPTEADFVEANKNSFGDAIGSITNRITGMFEVVSAFSKDSREYNEIMYRICCGQNFQQNAIDKAKGIQSKPMPKEWFDYKTVSIKEDDIEEVKHEKEFNINILAEKKPYFMNYIYPENMKEYNDFTTSTANQCIVDFDQTIEELIHKENKTEREKEFLKYYKIKMPCGVNPCIMNKICWAIEEEFDSIMKKKFKDKEFDISILKNENITYKKSIYNKINELYKEYLSRTQFYMQYIKKKRIDKEEARKQREIFMKEFQQKAFQLCSNEDELCNILIDLCYKNNISKQFCWDICSETIVNNLLSKNDNKIKYLEIDDDGEVEFGGYKFKEKEKVVYEEGEED